MRNDDSMGESHFIGQWIRSLDRIIRGDATTLASMKGGRIDYPLAGLSLLTVILAGAYGFCVGWFALFNRPDGPSFEQLFYTTVKMPLLFLLTLIVTFPSLYVFNALVGSRLNLMSLIRLLIAAMAVTLAVLASFGPIVAFFSVTTTSYPFMSLLNIFFCAVAGFLGLTFLLQTLHRLSIVTSRGTPWHESAPGVEPEHAAGQPGRASEAQGDVDSTSDAEDASSETGDDVSGASEDGKTGDDDSAANGEDDARSISNGPPTSTPYADEDEDDFDAKAFGGALDGVEGHVLGSHTKAVFKCWMVLFAMVGGQMSWVLRPFLGDPNQPTEFLREREGNFFEAVWKTIQQLFS